MQPAENLPESHQLPDDPKVISPYSLFFSQGPFLALRELEKAVLEAGGETYDGEKALQSLSILVGKDVWRVPKFNTTPL